MDEFLSDRGRDLSAISYLFGIWIAIGITLLYKEEKYTKFHSIQALILDVVFIVSYIFTIMSLMLLYQFGLIASIPATNKFAAAFLGIYLILIVVGSIFSVIWIIIRIYLAHRAFKGEKFKIPIIGNYAEKYSG